jgi:hypothetical protein
VITRARLTPADWQRHLPLPKEPRLLLPDSRQLAKSFATAGLPLQVTGLDRARAAVNRRLDAGRHTASLEAAAARILFSQE